MADFWQNTFNPMQTSIEMQDTAFERQKWLMSNAYQMQVEDMKKAGLNPYLAMSNGGSSNNMSLSSYALSGNNASSISSVIGSALSLAKYLDDVSDRQSAKALASYVPNGFIRYK